MGGTRISEEPGTIDQTHQIQSPFALLSGGYIGAFDMYSVRAWHQVTGEKRKFDEPGQCRQPSPTPGKATVPVAGQPAAQGIASASPTSAHLMDADNSLGSFLI